MYSQVGHCRSQGVQRSLRTPGLIEKPGNPGKSANFYLFEFRTLRILESTYSSYAYVGNFDDSLHSIMARLICSICKSEIRQNLITCNIKDS